MKKRIFSALVFIFAAAFSSGQAQKFTAQTLMKNSLEKENVQESITYLSSMTDSTSSAADKRSILYFLGSLQEQAGFYSDASYSYAVAAGIAAGDAQNMPKVSTEQLVLNAVRASLNAGDWETAEKYLNSAVRSSRNESILADVNLYSVWASLVKAQDISETEDSISLLKAYLSMQSMKSVKPAVLFTLWYLTADENYAASLMSEYPQSPEARIASGSMHVMSSPFWYFVPRVVHGDFEGVPSVSSSTAVSSSGSGTSDSDGESDSSPALQKIQTYQIGYYRVKANADAMAQEAKGKGFNAYVKTDTGSSGTVYYAVLVDEDSENSMMLKLKTAGYECVPF